MKKAFFLLALLGTAGASGTARADVNDFTFKSFSADYFLSRDQDRRSRLDVTERLTAVFPLTDQNHGIERVVPGGYDGHPVEIRVLSATDGSGTALALKTSSSSRKASAGSFAELMVVKWFLNQKLL